MNRRAIFGFLGLLLVLYVGSTMLNGRAGTTVRPVRADTTWLPAGFTAYAGDDEIGFQWIDHPSCKYSSGHCWGMYVVARYGCPNSLYGKVSLEDASGTAIGYTNDLLGSIAPMQRAQFSFDTFEARAKTARLTAINCY